MSPSELLQYLTVMVLLVGVIYTVSRALTLRRSLVDGLYRTRALWTAIGALSVAVFVAADYVDGFYGAHPATLEGVVAEATFWGVGLLFLLGWIFSNINVAISADFFNRDPLRWKRGGRFVVIAVFLAFYSLAAPDTAWFKPVISLDVLFGLEVMLFAVSVGYSAVVLLLTHARIQDKSIKVYTKWVVLTLISLVFYLFIIGTYGSGILGGADVLVIVPALAWVYCVIRSVGSLAIKTRILPS